MKILRAFSRLAVLAAACGLSAASMAEAIKVQDLAVGATVTRDGIDLGGTFSSDYLPVPDGTWTVKLMDDSLEHFAEIIGNVRWIRLVLVNQDKHAAMPLIHVRFNPKTHQIGIRFAPCGRTGTYPMVNGFESGPSQFMYRCQGSYYLKGLTRQWSRKLASNDKNHFTTREPMSVLAQDSDIMARPGSFVVTQFSGYYSAGYITNWQLYVRSNDDTLDKNTWVPGEPRYDAIAQWGQSFGDELGKFLKGGRVVLPTLPMDWDSKTPDMKAAAMKPTDIGKGP